MAAWIYPGPPATGAQAAYRARGVNGWAALRVQYFTLTREGVLELTTEDAYGENGFSPANARDVRAHALTAWVTVAAQHAAAAVLLAPGTVGATLRAEARAAIVDMVDTYDFSGAELDFEGAGRFTPEQFDAYVRWSADVAHALHARGRKLCVTVQPGTHRVWRNAAFGADHPCDVVTVMAYDYQYDRPGHGIAPFHFVRRVVTTLRDELGHAVADRKLVVGLPAYSYRCRAAAVAGASNGGGGGGGDDNDEDAQVEVLTFQQAVDGAASGDPRIVYAAPVDPDSGEHRLVAGAHIYFVNTLASLLAKQEVAAQAGARSFCVWHLGGGNQVCI